MRNSPQGRELIRTLTKLRAQKKCFCVILMVPFKALGIAAMTSSEMDRVHRENIDANHVSGRFLTDLLGTLERHGVSADQMIGDLPIPLDQSRITVSQVDWLDFVEFMKRLEHAVGGPSGLEECGACVREMKPGAALRGLAGMTRSPLSLYGAATRWALRRAMPGIETKIIAIDENHIDIHAQLKDGMRGCSQIFHFATGGVRALPQIIGLQDAVVEAEVSATEAHYRLTLPPSSTILARARRFMRTLFSAGSVLHVLESQQLELHAEHDALLKAHRDLADSEERYRAFSNAAVDVLCELDSTGHVVFVSASIEELLGYSPEQVTGSHFRLWVSKEFHERADENFEAIRAISPGGAFSRELVALHSANGGEIIAELSVRSFENSHGESRMACVVRDTTDPFIDSALPAEHLSQRSTQPTANPENGSRLDQIGRALAAHHQRIRRTPSRKESVTSSKVPRAGLHPLEQSLGRLVEALGHRTGILESAPEPELVRAGDTMSRIVDSALIGVEGELIRREWIETAKLLEAIRFEATERVGPGDVTIGSISESLPAEIWAHSDLLIAGLSSLFDAAWSAAAISSEIRLSVVPGPDSSGSPTIDFIVDTIPKAVAEREDRSPLTGNTPVGRTSNSRDIEGICEAIAADVARAHEGELTVDHHEGGYAMRRLRVSNSG
jgi:PAS domain S-box-containing protein